MRNTAIACLLLMASCQSAETKNEESTATETDTTMKSNLSSTDSAVNVLTDAEKKDGFELLFDGQSVGGWHVFKKETDGSSWKVVDGTLHFDNTNEKGGGDLVSEK